LNPPSSFADLGMSGVTSNSIGLLVTLGKVDRPEWCPSAEVLGAPADLAVRLTAARKRHAEHYRGVLAAADDLYLEGGVHVLSGLALFDLERRNIETGQAWASGCAADDSAAARLCVSYPDAGVYALDLRQHPHQSIAWLEAAATAARQIGDRRAEGNALGGGGATGAGTVAGSGRGQVERRPSICSWRSSAIGPHRDQE
jgi:hypothetical protein